VHVVLCQCTEFEQNIYLTCYLLPFHINAFLEVVIETLFLNNQAYYMAQGNMIYFNPLTSCLFHNDIQIKNDNIR
jgi:hypothetical protein